MLYGYSKHHSNHLTDTKKFNDSSIKKHETFLTELFITTRHKGGGRLYALLETMVI